MIERAQERDAKANIVPPKSETTKEVKAESHRTVSNNNNRIQPMRLISAEVDGFGY